MGPVANATPGCFTPGKEILPILQEVVCCGSLKDANKFLLVLLETANSDTRMSVSSVQYTTALHRAQSAPPSSSAVPDTCTAMLPVIGLTGLFSACE